MIAWTPPLANGELLPETLEFLNVGWWILHIISIAVVFWIGMVVGKARAGKAGDASE